MQRVEDYHNKNMIGMKAALEVHSSAFPPHERETQTARNIKEIKVIDGGIRVTERWPGRPFNSTDLEVACGINGEQPVNVREFGCHKNELNLCKHKFFYSSVTPITIKSA